MSRRRDGFTLQFAPNATCQPHVFGHDRDALGMDRAEIGVLEKANQICLGCSLQCVDSMTLHAEIRLEVLHDLTAQALEWQLLDEKIGRLLILADLAKSNYPRTPLTRLGGVLRLTHTSGLRSELLTRGLAAGGSASSLLCACNIVDVNVVSAWQQVTNSTQRGLTSHLVCCCGVELEVYIPPD